MKKMIGFIFIFMALHINQANAVSCGGSVYDMIECYEKANKKMKRAMTVKYNRLYKDRMLRKPLEHSQKAWLKYRNSHCLGLIAELASQAQGAGSALLVLECEAELNQLRLNQLHSLE